MKSLSKFVAIACLVFFATGVITSINSCTGDKTPMLSPAGGVCYLSDIQPVINSYCAQSGCHVASGHKPDLSTFSGVFNIAKNGKLMEVINGGGGEQMPPGSSPQLTMEQINLIGQWVSEGAGYNPDCIANGPCDTTNITYSGTVVPILQNNCNGCHGSSGSGGGILLNSYSVVKEQVNNGKLWGDINWDSNFNPMPKNGLKLSTCDIKKIGIWIIQGSPNN